jgi:hypothetical protein
MLKPRQRNWKGNTMTLAMRVYTAFIIAILLAAYVPQ